MQLQADGTVVATEFMQTAPDSGVVPRLDFYYGTLRVASVSRGVPPGPSGRLYAANFTEGAAGELRAGNLAHTAITDKGFDTDRSFMLVEVAGDEMYFQTISRLGETVDSGVIHRTVR